MDNIIIIEGNDLSAFYNIMREAVNGANNGSAYRIRVAIDGGVKVKVNEGMWTYGVGKADNV
jgi:hypothetical protein